MIWNKAVVIADICEVVFKEESGFGEYLEG